MLEAQAGLRGSRLLKATENYNFNGKVDYIPIEESVEYGPRAAGVRSITIQESTRYRRQINRLHWDAAFTVDAVDRQGLDHDLLSAISKKLVPARARLMDRFIIAMQIAPAILCRGFTYYC